MLSCLIYSYLYRVLTCDKDGYWDSLSPTFCHCACESVARAASCLLKYLMSFPSKVLISVFVKASNDKL